MIDLLREKINEFIKVSEEMLLEREEYVRLIMLVMFTKENIFFYGPPGTAKSLNVAILQKSFPDMDYFRLLMKDDTDTKEVFGDKVKADAASREKRLIEGMLPSANLAFLDEIFKANSEILNSLLTILNEKLFDNGAEGTIECPLYTAIGASNEFPRDKSLNALFERFVFRIEIPNVEERDSVHALLDEIDFENIKLPQFSKNDIELVQKEYKSVNQSMNVKDWIYNLRIKLHSVLNVHADYESDRYEISGRTLGKIAGILKVSAYLNKRDESNISEIMILKYILWNTLKQREDIKRVMDNEIFGKREIIKGKIEKENNKLRELFKRYYDFYKAIINDSIELNNEGFSEKRINFINYRNELEQEVSELDEILKTLNRNINYEKQIEENIFLHAKAVVPWTVEKLTVTEQNKKAIILLNDLLEEYKTINSELENWLEENSDYFIYKINHRNKGRTDVKK